MNVSRKSVLSHRMLALAVGTLCALAPASAFAQTGTATVPPLDTAGYNGVFTTLNGDIATVATGPIGLGAFGVLTIGIVFRIVWKLYKNAPKSLA